MSLRTFRLAVLAPTLLVMVAVAVAFFGSSETGSAYVMAASAPGGELPRPTALVSLPLLRIAPGNPHDRPITSPWAALVWLSLARTSILRQRPGTYS